MFELVKKIAKLNRIYSITISVKDDSVIYYALLLKKQKQTVEIIQQNCFSNFEDLIKNLDKSIPIILHFWGNGVVLKKINTENQNDNNWVRNLDRNVISTTVFKLGSIHYYSLLRNSSYEIYIDQFHANKLKLVELNFGPSILGVLKPYKPFKFILDDYSFDFSDSDIEEISRNQFEHSNGIQMHEDFGMELNYLPAYASGLNWYLNAESIESLQPKPIDQEEVYYESAFNRIGKFVLIFFLSSLLVSYFLVLWLGYKNSELTFEKVYSSKNIELTQKLTNELKEKMEILNSTGIASNKYLVYYIHELMKTIPSNVQLNEAKINPLKNEIKESKKVEFYSKEFVVLGHATSDIGFNEWITELKRKDWIKSLKIKNISKDKIGNVVFEINIEL